MYKRKKPRRIESSPLGSTHPHSLRVYYPLFFLIKLSCDRKKKKKQFSFNLPTERKYYFYCPTFGGGAKKKKKKNRDYLATWGSICTWKPIGGCLIQMGVLSPFSKLLIFNEFFHLTPRGIVATLGQNSQHLEPYDKRFNCIHVVPFDRGF